MQIYQAVALSGFQMYINSESTMVSMLKKKHKLNIWWHFSIIKEDNKTTAVKMLPYKFYYKFMDKNIATYSFATTVFISDTKPKLFYGKPRNQK